MDLKAIQHLRAFVPFSALWVFPIGFLLTFPAAIAKTPEAELKELFQQDRPFAAVPGSVFDRLGWSLPDGGSTVKALADAAPGGAFDPRKLENIDARELGYRAKWEVVRYRDYGLDWDISGLKLTPVHALAGMPTMVFVHGADANWYEFFVDQFNHPGLGQYLAQRVPVLLVSIPGNFKYGGWTEPTGYKRAPAYLLDRELSQKEVRVRNAVYTFRLVTDGVRQLIEERTSGPVVVIGHSTAGDIPFMLMNTSLKQRMNGIFLGWGSGGPTTMKRTSPEEAKQRGDRVAERFIPNQAISDLGIRNDNGKSEDSYYRHIGPLNPCPGSSPGEVAACWARQEGRRRPYFQQVLQVYEHLGGIGLLDKVSAQIRETLAGNDLGVNPDEVIADLFSTMRSQMTGYRRMLWLAGRLDYSHWNREQPEKSAEVKVGEEFRKKNPEAVIRVTCIDVPITHYGHIERPKELAGVMVTALGWLVEAPTH